MMIRKYILLFLSIACYTYFTQWDIVYFLIMSIIIIITSCTSNESMKKALDFVAVLSLVAGFILFKYTRANGMLLGYSVFAFSGISFVLDQYKKGKKYDMTDILLYLFFFPKMLAGPIVRVDYLTTQFATNTMSKQHIYKGVKLLIYACFLKFIIADIILNIDMTGIGFNLLIQTIIWGFRFYLDFYAYSLIAVGLALLVGISLPYNFDSPYSAMSFRDLWRRWNITLTQWLGNYVYIPLGGSRCTTFITCRNILLTFIVSGLWHGVTWPFILWGLCHGLLVSAERVFWNEQKTGAKRFIYRTFVVLITLFLWQFFRLTDVTQVVDYASQLFSVAPIDTTTVVYGATACGLIYFIEMPLTKRLMLGNENSPCNVICEVSILAVMLAVVILCPLHYTFNFFYLKY